MDFTLINHCVVGLLYARHNCASASNFMASLVSKLHISHWRSSGNFVFTCIQVYEVVPCLSDCGQYIWVAEPWSVWKVSIVDLKDNCGEGVQTRKVR